MPQCLTKKGYMIWHTYVARFSSSTTEFVSTWNCENATLSENLIHDISSPEEYSLEVKFCSGS